MKKFLSICCVLVLIISVFSVFTIMPASAETTKYVSGSIILPGDTTATEVTAFTYDDFEYENDEGLSSNWVPYYKDQTEISSGISVTSNQILGSNGLTIGNRSGSNITPWTARDYSIVPKYWSEGNKLTHISYDISGLGQTRFAILWPKTFDEKGYTTGTTDVTELPLNSVFSLRHAQGAVPNNSKIVAEIYPNSSQGLTETFLATDAVNGAYTTTPFHIDIDVAYSNVTDTSLTATLNVKIYSYLANGDYSNSTAVATTSKTISYDLTGKGITADELTLIPMIIEKSGNAATGLTYDNIKVESTYEEALDFVSVYGAKIENGTITNAEIEAASASLATLDGATANTLSYYSGKLNESISTLDKVTTDDFSSVFVSGNLWSNYTNFNISGGKVTGVADSSVVSVANGLLSKTEALTAVSFDYNDAKGTDQGTAGIYFPLYYANGETVAQTCFYTNNGNLRIGQHGGILYWDNFAKTAYSGDSVIGSGAKAGTITVFYDWSKFNAENNYIVTYYVHYTGEISGTTSSAVGYQTVQLDEALWGKVQPSDFKFAVRRVGELDNVSFLTDTDLSGTAKNKAASVYFNSENDADEKNGALVYRVSNATAAPSNFGAQVADYGSVFISNGSLVDANLTADDLALDTESAFAVNKETIEAAGVTDKQYNVRVNNTQTADWYDQKIVAKAYVTYKLGSYSFTVYSEPYAISNLDNVQALAQANNVTGSTFQELLSGLSTIHYAQ